MATSTLIGGGRRELHFLWRLIRAGAGCCHCASVAFAWIALGVYFVLLGSCQVGYRLGRHARDDETERARASTWHNALLALSGLLIGFTFSMAEARFTDRRKIVLEEANDIGTTYLRASLLDDKSADELRALLRRYIDARLAFAEAGAERGRIEATLRESSALERQIWSLVAAAARADRHSPVISLLVQATNAMFDAGATHVAAVESPLPTTVFLVLVLATAAAMATVGFACGLEKRASVHGMIAMPLLLATVILLVFDLAHPRLGMIRVHDPTLLRLKRSL
jgi:hypothetical protein